MVFPLLEANVWENSSKVILENEKESLFHCHSPSENLSGSIDGKINSLKGEINSN